MTKRANLETIAADAPANTIHGSHLPSSWTALYTLVKAMATKVDTMAADVSELLRRGDQALRAVSVPPLVVELTEFYGDAPFTAAEVLADAQLEADAGDARLRTALADVGVHLDDERAAHRLGVRLRTMTGVVRVRQGAGNVAVWVCRGLTPAIPARAQDEARTTVSESCQSELTDHSER